MHVWHSISSYIFWAFSQTILGLMSKLTSFLFTDKFPWDVHGDSFYLDWHFCIWKYFKIACDSRTNYHELAETLETNGIEARCCVFESSLENLQFAFSARSKDFHRLIFLKSLHASPQFSRTHKHLVTFIARVQKCLNLPHLQARILLSVQWIVTSLAI